MSEQPLNDPTPNLPLLRKVLDHIDAHPDEWYQATWGIQTERSACGTAFCIAGHAIAMSGEHVVSFDSGGSMLVDGEDYIVVEGVGEVEAPEYIGSRLLGLTSEEADDLFAGNCTREAVQRHAEAIAARAGERL